MKVLALIALKYVYSVVEDLKAVLLVQSVEEDCLQKNYQNSKDRFETDLRYKVCNNVTE